jgi:cyclopropane fatty-acyl-phospholipid synthase-like methyltransferase
MRASSGRLIGFNISERQVRYANERAQREHLAHKLLYRPGEAERLPGIEGSSVDRALAIECAFYFERPRFYERAAQVLKPAHTVSLSRPAKDGAWVSQLYPLDEEFTARWPATSSEAKPQVGSRP